MRSPLLIASGLFQLLDSASSESCRRPQPVEAVWNSRRMDEYLQDYPNANFLTFQDGYLLGLGIKEWSCDPGRELELTAHLNCNPSINDSDWMALKSVENWTDYVNSLSKKIDQIGFGLLHDSVFLLSSFVSDITLNQGRLHRRSMLGHAEVDSQAAKNAESLHGLNVELQPHLIKNNLDVPLVNLLVPKSDGISLKPPNFWVRLSRFFREMMRKGSQRWADRFRKPSRNIPYYPSPSRLLIVIDDPRDTENLKNIHNRQQEILKKWWSIHSQPPSDAKEANREIDKEVMKLKEQWKELDREENALEIKYLRKQSEKDVDEYKNVLEELQSLTTSLETLREVQPTPSINGKKGIKKADNQIKRGKKISAQGLADWINAAKKGLQNIESKETIHSTPLRASMSIPELKKLDPSSHPPPPPEIINPNDLFSTKSANIAYQKNLLRDEWNDLYREKLEAPKEKAPETEEEIQKKAQLSEVISKWKELHEKHLIIKRMEFIQEAIDKGASSKDMEKKKILKGLRRINLAHREQMESMIALKREHGTKVDEMVEKTDAPFIKNLLIHINNNAALKKQKKNSHHLRKRDSNFDSSRIEKLLEKDQKDLILNETGALISKNTNQILKISPLNIGIFKIIRHAQFLSQVNSHLVVEDLKILIQIHLISHLLKNQNMYLTVNLSSICDPIKFKSTINDEDAEFCRSDGRIIKILKNQNEEEDEEEPLNLKELEKSFHANRYQLSDLVNLSLECQDIKDKTFQPTWIQAGKSEPLSRLTGISACAIDLPIHYLINN